MKAKIENGKIQMYPTLPSTYNGVTGSYPGNFHLQPEDILKLEGFFDVVVPSYDPQMQLLGEIFFDEASEVFTYPVTDKELDLAQLKQERLDEFSRVLDQFAILISRCKLIHGDDNAELNSAIEQTRQMRLQTITNINAIQTVPEMVAFKIQPDDVAAMKALFEPFK